QLIQMRERIMCVAPEHAGWAMTVAAVLGMAVAAPAQTSMPATPVAAPTQNSLPAPPGAAPFAPVAKHPETPSVLPEYTIQLAAIKVELAWLANSLTFPHPLAVRVDNDHLEVGGQVPNAFIREQAVKIAQEEGRLHVVDKIVVQPYPVPPPTRQAN